MTTDTALVMKNACFEVTISRFGGGGGQDWLKWVCDFNHLAKLWRWGPEERGLMLRLVLEADALDAWKAAVGDRDLKDEAKFAEAFTVWGQMHVSDAYSEQLEEELHAFIKRPSESVAECHKRFRQLTRMLSMVPGNAVVLTNAKLIQYFKHAMPMNWQSTYAGSGTPLNTIFQAVDYFERLEQSERRRGCQNRGDFDDCECEASNSPVQLQIHLSGAKTPLVARVSTGCHSSYINARLVAANKKVELLAMVSPGDTVELTEGPVPIEGYATVQFRLFGLHYNTRITSTFAVVRDAKDDMVIGNDLLCGLGLIVNFSDGIIEWNGDSVSLNTRTYL
ncbi:hypothetical protein PF008_g8173 [Phytophthora fragariae]|uniref:Retrotransposon gag domain-containing protein n=1 Tax=Phytophthora fragariae TaxID=53985 RepID=A0A6G0S0A4_9STRA|nr:hypothetical protein PF008_g8173 [Phytophthora fragariae]